MARKIKTEQEKKKTRKKIIIIIISILCLIAAIFGIAHLLSKDEPSAVKVNILKQDENYGYTLTDKDSEYYKSEFDKLIDIIKANPIDEEAYATQVARMFTIDLYTMSTKINKYDIGGYEFYYSDKKDNLENTVIYGIYSSMLDDTYGTREQNLPEITNVETVSTEKTTYKLGEKEVEGYLVKLKMTYKEDLGYDKEGSVVVCKEEGIRWSVVDFQPTLEPKYDEKK